MSRQWAIAALAAGLAGCGGEVVYADRSGCLACHRPMRPNGVPEGIERAHPLVGGEELTCVACHGGDPDARRQSEAHVAPGPGDPPDLRPLSPRELDRIDPAYLRFVNPGDLRVAAQACGDEGCHGEVVERVLRSPMATAAGELSAPRFRADSQPSAAGVFGVSDAFDPQWRQERTPGTVESLRAMEEFPIGGDEEATGPYLDLLLTKRCLRCHMGSYGEGRAPGTYRSSGCSACHMVYADDGLSRSGDPMIDKGAPAHPVRHELTSAIPTEQCAHCHHDAARIGPSYQGYREVLSDDAPPGATPLGRALYGKAEDGWISLDTPPDAHFAAGMACVDCHVGADVHGDGRLWTDGAALVRIRCEHCHAVDEPSGAGAPEGLLVTRREGRVSLTGRLDGVVRDVPQVSLGGDAPGAHHGSDHATLRCDTCHSGWLPSCYGCHVTVDLSTPQTSALTGALTPGSVDDGSVIAGVATDALVLVVDHEGRIAPSMPAERVFMDAFDGLGRPAFVNRARPGMGQRAVAPHTVRRNGPFAACDKCHPSADGDDASARQAAGFGGRREARDENGAPVLLDRVVDPDTLEATVRMGREGSTPSQPLPPDTIRRMLSVTAP